MEHKYQVSQLVKIKPNKDESCQDCSFTCSGKVGTIVNSFEEDLGFHEGYYVDFETGACFFDVSELEEV